MKVEEINLVLHFTLGSIARFDGCIIYDDHKHMSIIDGNLLVVFHYIKDVAMYDKYIEQTVCSIVERFVPDDIIKSDVIPVNFTIIVKGINDEIKFIKPGNVQVWLVEDKEWYYTKLQI